MVPSVSMEEALLVFQEFRSFGRQCFTRRCHEFLDVHAFMLPALIARATAWENIGGQGHCGWGRIEGSRVRWDQAGALLLAKMQDVIRGWVFRGAENTGLGHSASNARAPPL